MNTESKLREALQTLFKDAMYWGRSYGSRYNLSDFEVEDVSGQYADQAIAALTQPQAQQATAVQAGWKLVPIEPTPEMVDAGNKARLYREHGSLELSDVLSARTYNTKQSYTATTGHSPGNMAQPIHDPAVTTPREVLVGESPVDRIAAPAQEHVPVSAEESAAIDATLDLFTLPPIRVSEAVYVELHEQAKASGVIVQAHVRQLLEQQQAGVAEVSDDPAAPPSPTQPPLPNHFNPLAHEQTK